MLHQDLLLGILGRIQSPTHGAASSQLQIAAMQQSGVLPNQSHVDFDSLSRSDISILQNTLKQLEEDAATVLTLHNAIEGRIKTAQVFYQRATAALAPINRLPAEVLARVFAAGKHLELNFSPRISWIARRWRDIALSTPDLWNRIPITNFARVSTYLERSGSTPLDIEVDLRTYRINTFGLGQCMNALEPHLLRWQSIKVLVEDHDQTQPILRQLETLCAQINAGVAAGHLSSIYFGVPTHSPNVIASRYTSSMSIPAIATLQAIELLGIDLHYLPSDGSAAFQNVHVLTLSSTQNMHLSDLFGALASMPNLDSLILDQCEFPRPAPVGDSPLINLTKLRTLEISYMSDETTNLISARLHAPYVRRFALYSHRLYGPSRVLDWEGLRTRYPALSVLKLHNIASYAARFIVRWLKELPELLSLTMVFRELGEPSKAIQSTNLVLQALSELKPQICPMLRTLKVGDLAEKELARLRITVEARPLLKPGKVSFFMRAILNKSTRAEETTRWLRANLSNMKIHDTSDDENEDASEGDSGEETD